MATSKRDSKIEKYKLLVEQVTALIGDEENLIANLANTAAAIYDAFKHHWVGFYIVDDTNDTLVLGPFQGPVACTRIDKHRGVCGKAWRDSRTVVVDNVHEFPGHIACSSLSNSEIVIPLLTFSGDVYGVLDIDSREFGDFDDTDVEYLEIISEVLRK